MNSCWIKRGVKSDFFCLSVLLFFCWFHCSFTMAAGVFAWVFYIQMLLSFYSHQMQDFWWAVNCSRQLTLFTSHSAIQCWTSRWHHRVQFTNPEEVPVPFVMSQGALDRFSEVQKAKRSVRGLSHMFTDRSFFLFNLLMFYNVLSYKTVSVPSQKR